MRIIVLLFFAVLGCVTPAQATPLYFVNQSTGAYLGSFDGPNGGYWNGTAWGAPPSGVIAVSSQPNAITDTWSGTAWVPNAAVAAAANAQTSYANAVQAGLTIACGQGASVCSSAIAGRWALDPTTLDQIGSVARDFGANLGLPGGLSTFTYPDATQTPRTMSGAQLEEVYKAERDYMLVLQTDLAAAAQGAPVQWPAATVTLQ